MNKDFYDEYKMSDKYETALINLQYWFDGHRVDNEFFNSLHQCIKEYKIYEEKDTPKPIIYSYISTKIGGLSEYICPICGSRVQDLDHYCWNCGQRLEGKDE